MVVTETRLLLIFMRNSRDLLWQQWLVVDPPSPYLPDNEQSVCGSTISIMTTILL